MKTSSAKAKAYHCRRCKILFNPADTGHRICPTCAATCSGCGIALTKENQDSRSFEKRKCYVCKHCVSERIKKHSSPEKQRDYDLKRFYGITQREYEIILEKQDGKCAICLVSSDDYGKRFHVDHCHTTNKVRGLLCSSCNTGVGMFKDNSDILTKAAQYVDK